MLLKRVESAFTKAGFTVSNEGGRFVAERSGIYANWYRNGDSDRAVALRVRRASDHDNPLEDYSAGSYFRTISHAVQHAVKLAEEEEAEAKNSLDGLTRATATALHDWVAFGFAYHSAPATPSPTRRKQLKALESRGFIDRDGVTPAGRKWVDTHLAQLIG